MKSVISKKAHDEKKEKKLRFGTYPYTAVRAIVMKSLLLKKEDYMRMRKMGTNEIIRFLGESRYKREIDEISKDFGGIELANVALNANLARTINKLIRISLNEEVKGMIRLYANKWVINNLKIVIRVKMNGLDAGYIKYGVIPIEPATYKFCTAIYEGPPEKMAKEIEGMGFMDYDTFMELYSKKDLMSIENHFDRGYYSALFATSKSAGSKIIKEFLKNLVNLMNIRNIVKLKAAGIERKLIEEFVIGEKDAFIIKLIDSDIKKIPEILRRNKYAVLGEDIDKDIANLENNIERFLLRYSSKLIHSRKPMSIAPIFGFLLAKEIEVRNLKLLLNSRDSGLEEDFVDKNLIVLAG